MTQELKLTNEETTALDRIDAELRGFSTRAATLAATEGGVGELCDKYHKIRAALLILISIVKKIPAYGGKIAAALEFLMGIADAVCPA
jgi:hypothetical protein